jgi:hypothetical protein
MAAHRACLEAAPSRLRSDRSSGEWKIHRMITQLRKGAKKLRLRFFGIPAGISEQFANRRRLTRESLFGNSDDRHVRRWRYACMDSWPSDFLCSRPTSCAAGPFCAEPQNLPKWRPIAVNGGFAAVTKQSQRFRRGLGDPQSEPTGVGRERRKSRERTHGVSSAPPGSRERTRGRRGGKDGTDRRNRVIAAPQSGGAIRQNKAMAIPAGRCGPIKPQRPVGKPEGREERSRRGAIARRPHRRDATAPGLSAGTVVPAMNRLQ